MSVSTKLIQASNSNLSSPTTSPLPLTFMAENSSNTSNNAMIADNSSTASASFSEASEASASQLDPSSPAAFNDTLNVETEPSSSDLEDIVYAILMLIVEGRRSSQIKEDATFKESAHVGSIVDHVLAKVFNLNINTTATTNHTCSKKNIQCQIASKLKDKLEKCMKDHYQLEKQQLLISNALTSSQQQQQQPQKPNFISVTPQNYQTQHPLPNISNHSKSNSITTANVSVSHSKSFTRSTKNNYKTNLINYTSPTQHYNNTTNNNSQSFNQNYASNDSDQINLLKKKKQQEFNNSNSDEQIEDADNDDDYCNINSKKSNYEENDDNDSIESFSSAETIIDGPLLSSPLTAFNNNNNNNPNTTASITTTSDQSTSATSSSLTINSTPVSDASTTTTTTHIVVDVCLLADCCYNELTATSEKSGDSLINFIKINNRTNRTSSSADNNNRFKEQELLSYEILERWSISMTNTIKSNQSSNKDINTSKSLLTFNELFQAIKSYLHFSQISSWQNQTKGQQPKNIAFSVSCSSDIESQQDLPLFTDSSLTTSSNNSDNKLLNQQFKLNTHEFDFQTFPSIGLLLQTNTKKLNFNNTSRPTYPSKSSTRYSSTKQILVQQQQQQQQLSFATLVINLQSRKRRNSPVINSVDHAIINGIPQVYCNKAKHLISSLSSPVHSPSSLFSTSDTFYKLINTNKTNSSILSEHNQQAALNELNNQLYSTPTKQYHGLPHPNSSNNTSFSSILFNNNTTYNSPPPLNTTSLISNSKYVGRQHYYLPHWSSIMTSSSSILVERRRPSLELDSSISTAGSPVPSVVSALTGGNSASSLARRSESPSSPSSLTKLQQIVTSSNSRRVTPVRQTADSSPTPSTSAAAAANCEDLRSIEILKQNLLETTSSTNNTAISMPLTPDAEFSSNMQTNDQCNADSATTNKLTTPDYSSASTMFSFPLTPNATPSPHSTAMKPSNLFISPYRFIDRSSKIDQQSANSTQIDKINDFNASIDYSEFYNNDNQLPLSMNAASFLISQSPKVLVSNYQLVADLCAYTQNQLKLNDQNNNTNNNGSNSEYLLLNQHQSTASAAADDDDDDNNLTETLNNSNKRKYQSLLSSSSDSSPVTLIKNSHDQPLLSNLSTPQQPLSTTLSTSITSAKSNDDSFTINNSAKKVVSSLTGESKQQLNVKPMQSQEASSEIETLESHYLNVSLADSLKFVKGNNDDNNNNLPSNSSNSEKTTLNLNNNNNGIPISPTTMLKKIITNNSNDTADLKPNKQYKSYHHYTRSGLPLSSSPAPMRKSGSLMFDFDHSLKNPKSIKKALTPNLIKHVDDLEDQLNEQDFQKISDNKLNEDENDNNNNYYNSKADYSLNDNNNSVSDNLKASFHNSRSLSISYKSFNMQCSNSNMTMTMTPNRLLGSFEESLLNGRMNPVGVVDGFYAEIGASGSFFPEHATLPVYAAFYHVCEDIAASPYLGVINLNSLGKRGYKVPNKGTIQVTLFNPNNTVVKMFVVMYDLSDMPPNHRTFLRQRTMYVPLVSNSSSSASSSSKATSPTSSRVNSKRSDSSKDSSFELDDENDTAELKSYLRYLIHLRFNTSKSGKMYLHTNIKLIFARNKCEIDPRLACYEYKTFTEAPKNPRYSPKK
jgi:hypothetical protein